jgi:hypothetical protein
MNNNEMLTPENFKEVIGKQAGTLQHGYVTGYTNLLISQPTLSPPPALETDAFLYLRLDIEPDSNSDIAVLYIKFEPEQAAYAPVRYSHRNGNASKPISQYAATVDLLKSAQTNARKVEVFLQVNDDGRNALVLL